MKLVMRPFSPTIVAALSCPRAKQAWVLSNDCFDYRSASNSEALNTRDGQWFSRCETSFTGDLALRSPQDVELPDMLRVNMRASWYPAHCTITWLDGGATFRKLPHRAPEGEPSRWETITYDDTVFTTAHRLLYPEAFFIVPAPTRPSPTETSPPVTEPSVTAKTQEESFPPRRSRLVIKHRNTKGIRTGAGTGTTGTATNGNPTGITNAGHPRKTTDGHKPFPSPRVVTTPTPTSHNPRPRTQNQLP